jgi:hypothetical protein
MEKALATLRNGHVELDHAVDWPDGIRLQVSPADKKLGLEESEWPNTPEEKAEWIRWLESLEPFEMSASELNAFEAELKASKERQKQLLRESWAEETT